MLINYDNNTINYCVFSAIQLYKQSMLYHSYTVYKSEM